MDDLVHIRHIPREETAPGSTMGRRQASGGSVMFWATFCWKTLGPAIDVVVTLTHATYLNIVADQVYPFLATVFPDGSGHTTRFEEHDRVQGITLVSKFARSQSD